MRISLIASLALSCSLFACAAASPTQPQDENPTDESADVKAEGRICGPDAVTKSCPSGYLCDFTGGVDVGHCRKISGHVCGVDSTWKSCPSGYYCNYAGGVDVGKCAKETAGMCESASDCTGALPRSCVICSDGSTACAHFDCIDHKCSIAYCEDKPECTTDSDCKGALPDSCMICSDGSTGCAHHVCIAGKCGISYCG